MERGLFGRETELARVSKLLDGIPSGPIALILAGIGKRAPCGSKPSLKPRRVPDFYRAGDGKTNPSRRP
jgi:hypothetical protein